MGVYFASLGEPTSRGHDPQRERSSGTAGTPKQRTSPVAGVGEPTVDELDPGWRIEPWRL